MNTKPSRPSPSPSPRAPERTRQAAGYSLFELLLVLAVLAIVASMVLPWQPGASERQLLDLDAHAVYGALVDARATAIARQTEARFVVDDGHSYRIEIRESPARWTVARRGSVHSERVSVTIDRSEDGTVTFFPHGGVDVARTVSARARGGPHVVTLEVLASGLVRWAGEGR